MSYSFRIRVNCSPNRAIHSEKLKLTIPIHGSDDCLILCNPASQKPIKDAEQLVLSGAGYGSHQDAFDAGSRFLGAFKVALARVRVGVDFGERAAGGCYTTTGLNMLAMQHGRRVLNNAHGLLVYETEPKPVFASIDAQAIVGFNADMFTAILAQSVAQNPDLSERDQLAFSFFNASLFRVTADARFLLLVMAIEALSNQISRSDTAVEHVDKLISVTFGANIPNAEKDSMIGALHRLKLESIKQAGRRLISERLGERNYENKPAPRYFSDCYDVRSKLVHGKSPIKEEVARFLGTLEVLVSDLLTVPFLDLPNQTPEK